MCEQNTLPAVCRLKQVAIELGQCSERIGRYTPSFTIIVLHLKHSVYRISHLLYTQNLHILPMQPTQVFRLNLRTTAVNWLVLFKTCFYCEMETDFLNIVEMNFILSKTTIYLLFLHCANSTTLGFKQLRNTAVLLTLHLHTPYNPQSSIAVPFLSYVISRCPIPLSPSPSLSLSLSLSLPLLRALSHTVFTHLENEGDWLYLNCIKSTQRRYLRATTLSHSLQVIHFICL
jgi:hypothetical protein